MSGQDPQPDSSRRPPARPADEGGDRAQPPPTVGFGSPSGSQQPPDRPYGEQPPPSYGEGPPTQPSYGEGPPTQPSYGEAPPPYGQAPYGYGQPPAWGPPDHQQHPPQYPGYQQYGGYPPYRQQDPDRRPTTVTIAAWLTWVLSGLTLLAFGAMVIAMVAARDELLDSIRGDSQFQDLDIGADDLVAALWVVSAVLIFWCVCAIVLGVLAYRRVSWARIMLVVSASSTVLLALVAIGSVISAVHLLVAGTVIVLLFTGGANQWYSRKGGFLPGYPSYPPAGGYGGQYGSQQGNPYAGSPNQPSHDEGQEPPKKVW